jgi:DNA-binding response OmpR family regulator
MAAGRITGVIALVISADPAVREQMALAVRGVERTIGEQLEFLWASDGVRGIALARRHLPDVVVADEISSRAGAFAVAQDLKGGDPPYPGVVVILLDRAQDEWLAAWSGADAWFVKPVDPFALADRVTELVRRPAKEAV